MDGFVKITSEMVKQHNIHLLDLLTNDVREEIKLLKSAFCIRLLRDLVDCESPIEQIMALRLNRDFASHVISLIEQKDKIRIETISNQVSISDYRVDFLIITRDLGTGERIKFIVECDGHDYHEKTKGQAQRDKKRDRDLTAAGYIVLRYTGSEIVNNYNISQEVFQSIRDIVLKRREGR